MSKELKILEFDIEIISVPYTIGVSRNLESDGFFCSASQEKNKNQMNFAYDL